MPPPLIDDFAALVPRFTGCISVISSSTIIYLIRKSETKLSTIYHRIMFGISIADICSSVATSLTTLPMPRDLPISEIGYDWAGTRLGNVQTCNAQGFFVIAGFCVMFAYTGMLCIYYMLAIAFTMEEKKIAKYVEPFFHLFSLGVSSFAFWVLFAGKIQATGWQAYCTIRTLYGPSEPTGSRRVFSYALIGSFFISSFVCFGLIINKVVKDERKIRKNVQYWDDAAKAAASNLTTRMRRIGGAYDRNNPNPEQREMQLRAAALRNIALKAAQNTRLIFGQALAYYLSFLLTLSTPAVRLLIGDGMAEDTKKILLRSQLVIMPLHGLFNAIIFIYHKIRNYRRIHPDVSKWQALCLLFYGKADDNVFISKISVVSIHAEEVAIEIQNERNDVEHLSIAMSSNQTDDVEQQLSLDDGSTSKRGGRDLSGFSFTSSGSFTGSSLNTGSSPANVRTDEALSYTSTRGSLWAIDEGRAASDRYDDDLTT
jgi:hypothetical protein